MNVSYINPFIEASSGLVTQLLNASTDIGKPFIRNTPYGACGVTALIGITGKIKGSAVISLDEKTVCNIVSIMMGGMEITEVDELAKSAIGEFANMLIGNAATLFSSKSIIIDITPPTIISGSNVSLSMHSTAVICIPMKLHTESKVLGDMTLDISFVEN